MTDTCSFADLALDFNALAARLTSLKPKDFYELENRVNSLRSMIDVIITAKKVGLAKDDRLKTLGCAFSDATYCDTVVGLLEFDLPVIESLYEHEEGEPYYLMMDTVGMNCWSEAETCDLFQDPGNYDEKHSLTAFLMLINYGITDDESWAKCKDFYGWPIERTYSVPYEGEFDGAYLKRTLRRRGAPPEVFTTVMLTFFPPEENPLLTVTADDWECDPSVMELEVNYENVRWLKRMGTEAKRLCADIEPALEWVMNNAWFIPILGETIEESRKEKIRVRA